MVKGRILEIAKGDPRVVAGALVGSSASGGDRWSDLDIAFGLGEGVSMEDALAAWTSKMEEEFDAFRLFDLPHRTSVYRVFMLPGSLQVDLSFTPEADFGATGPRFSLLFGKAVQKDRNAPPTAEKRSDSFEPRPRKPLWQSAPRNSPIARSCSSRLK